MSLSSRHLAHATTRAGLRAGLFAGSLALVGLWAGAAEALDPEECQLKWGQAARSYLTQNRTKGPEDKVFAAACALEASGKKEEARVEATMIAARELAKLDPRGCVRFMDSYIGSSRSKDVCDLANAGDEAKLRKAVTDSMPPPPASKGGSTKKVKK